MICSNSLFSVLHETLAKIHDQSDQSTLLVESSDCFQWGFLNSNVFKCLRFTLVNALFSSSLLLTSTRVGLADMILSILVFFGGYYACLARVPVTTVQKSLPVPSPGIQSPNRSPIILVPVINHWNTWNQPTPHSVVTNTFSKYRTRI